MKESTSLPNGNVQQSCIRDHLCSIIGKCKNDFPEHIPERILGLLLPISISLIFGLALADIEEYTADHNISFLRFTAVVSVSFLFVYWIIHEIKDYLANLLHFDDKTMSSSIMWLLLQIFIGVISVSLYWYLFKDFILHFSQFQGAEKEVFEYNLKAWIVSIYLTSFLFSNNYLSKRLINCILELIGLFRRKPK